MALEAKLIDRDYEVVAARDVTSLTHLCSIGPVFSVAGFLLLLCFPLFLALTCSLFGRGHAVKEKTQYLVPALPRAAVKKRQQQQA